jgi:hypothetical protein
VPGSSKLEEIGVILHGIDGFEDKQRPWRSADPSSGEGFLSDRISASIVYAGKALSFSTDSTMGTYLHAGSYIFDPFAVSVLCAYGGDGATRGKTCNPPGLSSSCIPACLPNYNSANDNSRNQWDRWCVPRGASDYFCDAHPWRPRDIGKMLERDRAATKKNEPRDEHHAYNEIVIDGHHSNAHLPGVIEAFVVARGDDHGAARGHHQAFLREYGLSAAQVPMLEYRPEADGHGGNVFVEI